MKREEERRVGIDLKDRQVLLIINEPEVCKRLQKNIHEKFGFETETAVDGQKALNMIRKSPWKYDMVVIYDNFQNKPDGLEILKSIKKSYPEIEVISIIDSTDKTTVDAWREGAFNCFSLPINSEGIAHSVKFASDKAQFQSKMKMVDKFQKIVDLLELVHLATSKPEIFNACIDDMLTIFNAQAGVIFETEKETEVEQSSLIKLSFFPLYIKKISSEIKISKEILIKIEKGKPRLFNATEFPEEWNSIKDQYSQCLAFTLDFQEEILGIVILFTKAGVPSILQELEIYNLATAISRQLAIAFKNLEFGEEIARVRAAEPAIISDQYVSGMIHELASSAHKGKGAFTYIRGTSEYKKVKSQNWKIEFSKIESAFDDIGEFTNKALEIKDIARMKFEKTLEYRSINKAIQDVLHDINNEARKKSAYLNWHYDKSHNQRHAYFNEILIKQAIRNLISNSLRWISIGGSIKITSSQKGDYISILVEDNGKGIELGTEKRIFDPYFTTSPKGYGIGLFFVKNVVKMHDGDVKLVSAKNPTSLEIKISARLKKEVIENDTMHFNCR